MLASTAQPFELFGAGHLGALAAIVLATVALCWIGRRHERIGRFLVLALAGGLLAHEGFKTWLWIVVYEQPWQRMLPLHLCDIAVLVTVYMLVTRSPRAHELVWFWGLGGTAQAILTPDLPFGWPHPTFVTFMVSHGIVVAAALFGTLVYELRPEPASIPRVFLATNLYAAAVTPVNLLLDANYLYLRAKPEQPSLIDHLGPWPWYLLSLELVMLVSFAVYYAPFLAWDALRSRRGDSDAEGFAEEKP